MTFRDNCRRHISHSVRMAHEDFVRGILSWRLWWGLGVQDIRIRYKRTLLGPWWITASQAVGFICMGMLFSAVFKNDVRIYLPYLAIGMVTWSLIVAMAGDGPNVFVGSHHIITSLRIPLVVHVLRCAVRNALIFFHNLSAALAAHLLLGGKITATWLLLLLSLPILLVAMTAICLMLAVVGARFRDLSPVIGITTQLLFFMTPIMWHPDNIPDGNKWWVAINPAYHLIEMVRAPMLGTMPALDTLAIGALAALVLSLAAYLLFCMTRHRIAFWL